MPEKIEIGKEEVIETLTRMRNFELMQEASELQCDNPGRARYHQKRADILEYAMIDVTNTKEDENQCDLCDQANMTIGRLAVYG